MPTEVLLAEQRCRQLRTGARWHGFEQLTDCYVMTDPNKLTLVTPGVPPGDGVVAGHPEQGWSLLCNGIVLFDDAGALLPGGRVVAPPAPVELAAAA